MTAERASAGTLPILLRVIAANAFITGSLCIVLGPDFASVLGLAPASIDRNGVDVNLAQEFRFMAVWWFGAGLYLWSLAARVRTATKELRIVCALLFASGAARWVTFALLGWPHPLFVVVAGIEIVAPLPLLWLQARMTLADVEAPPNSHLAPRSAPD
ncbi:DUF4345 domain-containing protein [Microbacterium sp.]|uniref:DUF4345 domain-containing protein n=1 Tax=Microbacterium sp. TaxID=51671 RepID=UPI00273344DB|nr:DUF4345 domain-containing protein [Microbacterium sp.]MDP3952444.1 DUF4345 domain-containing protein [Microbacterium sp.]